MPGAGNRLILHCDCNNFYASCECLVRPELKSVPMAVAGDPETRTGIVFAKNDLAKRCGVKTTDTLWQAKRKCPEIVFVPPRYPLYEQVSRRVNAIYLEYSDLVEPASIDESYIDMTGACAYYGMTPAEIADVIRGRVREEVGVTISVGVSFNKVFAKMGSDYRKPDVTTCITEENFREILWPLPVTDMLYVGKSGAKALAEQHIATIGDLAQTDRSLLAQWLGKGGEGLWRDANGLDEEPVRRFDDRPAAKSVSHGMTFPRDLVSEEEARAGLGMLSDEVAADLRRQRLKGCVVQLQIKTPALVTLSRQTTLSRYTYLQKEILDVAMRLLRDNWRIGPTAPVRALTVGVIRLIPAEEVTEQMSLFDMGQPRGTSRERQEKLETAIAALREKHGGAVVTHGFPGLVNADPPTQGK